MPFTEDYQPDIQQFGFRTQKDAYFGGDVEFAGTVTGGLFVSVGGEGADYITDGTADNVQIQAAIDAASTAGGGTVLIKEGTYSIATNIKPKSNVYLKGAGMFSTKLVATSTMVGGSVIADTTTFTVNAPLENFIVSDLEIDCSNMPTTPYSIGRKGLDSKNWRRCSIRDLYVHDAPATGIGVDNLDRCLIDHCIVKDCGTTGESQGSNGIGIGTGGMTAESFVVSNCITEGTANSAYLVEELDTETTSREYVFANNISYSDFKGVSVSGAKDVVVANNHIFDSGDDGIRAIDFSSHIAESVTISGNMVKGSASEGIYIDTGVSDIIIHGNHIHDGTIEGIVTRGFNVVISENQVHENGKHGIFIGAASGGDAITDVIVTGNMVFNNSAVTANTDGIRLDATNADISDVIVSNNRSFDNQGTQTQRYGLIMTGTNMNRIIVSNNNCNDNKTGSLFNNVTNQTSVSIVNNMGINPDSIHAQGNVTGATTFNRANGSHITATLTGDVTVTLTAGVFKGDELTLELTQDGTGNRLVTWPSNFKKAGGSLTLSTGAAAVDIVKMRYDGTNWVEVSRSLNIS